MANKPSIKKYIRIIHETLYELIIKDTKVLLIMLVAVAVNIASAYMAILTTKSFGGITESFQTENFDAALKKFLYLTLITLGLKYLPYGIFNYYCQDLQRKSFALNLKNTLDLNYADFNSKTAGDLNYAINIKSYSCPMICQFVLLDFISVFATVFFGVREINQNIDLMFALIFALTPILYFLGLYFYIRNKINYHYDLLKKEQYASGKLTDKLLNYEAIKTFGLEQSETNDFYNIIGLQTQSNIKLGKYEAMTRYLLTFTTNIPFIIMLVFLYFAKYETNDTEKFIILALLFTGIASDLRRLGVDIDQLIEYLNQINFSEIEQTDNNIEYTDEILSFNNTIEWKNVKTMYKDKVIIDDINIKIKKGEKICLVGKNGTGKSTLLKSLLGFTKYTGDIEIDGTILKRVKRDKLMNLISYIPQDDCTSDDTVMNNILLGLNNEDTTNLSRDQQIRKIKGLSQQYNTHDAFKELDNGYETQAGPRGIKLSGGQKQKISLMRAVLKDSPIFIFDEATAAMDKKAEKDSIELILNNLNDKTIIMIVHGKEFLHLFDKIIFLNNGKVEEIGTYEYLLKNNKNFIEQVK